MQRIFLIDLLRCIAIVSMVAFHVVYDLAVFYGYSIDYERGFWQVLQMLFAGGLFIFVSGWTASIGRRSWTNLLHIGFAAMLVSLVTYFQFGNMYVRFGVLHLLFTANLLYILILHILSTRVLFLLALLLSIIIKPLTKIVVAHEYFVWLDILPIGYQSVDHYPVLPWLIVFIIGVIWGRLETKAFTNSFEPAAQWATWITKCSKNSLAIYLLHQPVILLILYFVLQ